MNSVRFAKNIRDAAPFSTSVIEALDGGIRPLILPKRPESKAHIRIAVVNGVDETIQEWYKARPNIAISMPELVCLNEWSLSWRK